MQSLWGGYGELVRVALDGGATAIVKRVDPPAHADSIGDARKRRSYTVERAFYRLVAPRCDETCRVARLLGERGALLVLEDLDAAGFAGRVDGDAEGPALAAALGWLASFHARFVGERFDALWESGTYWHLGTRRDELANIRDRALRDDAEALDAALAGARFQTLLHGDPKEANFCFGARGAVAAVDFQYAGRGCGMRDVAYLLHGRGDDPAPHLDAYFRALRAALAPAIDGAALEAEWRALFPIAVRDFRRFLAGWRPGRVLSRG